MKKIVTVLWLAIIASVAFPAFAANIVDNPTSTQLIAQPGNTDFFVNKFNKIRYANQFEGSDIGARINAAKNDCLNAGLDGCEIVVPAGYYSFSTSIIIDRNIILRGAGQGINGSSSGFGTLLSWSGGPGVAITITGTNRQATIRDIALDNTGGGTVGIDIDNYVNHVFIEHVTIYPQGTGFSEAAVRIGNTANVTDITLRDVYIRNNAVGVDAHRMSAHLVLDHARLMQNTAYDLVLGRQLSPVWSFHATNSTFEGMYGTSSVKIFRANNVGFSNCYFENVGPGFAIDIAQDAVQAWNVSVTESYFCGSAYAPYAIRLDFPSAYFNLTNSFFASYEVAPIYGPSYGRLLVTGNDLYFTGNMVTNVIAGHVVMFGNSSGGVLQPGIYY